MLLKMAYGPTCGKTNGISQAYEILKYLSEQRREFSCKPVYRSWEGSVSFYLEKHVLEKNMADYRVYLMDEDELFAHFPFTKLYYLNGGSVSRCYDLIKDLMKNDNMFLLTPKMGRTDSKFRFDRPEKDRLELAIRRYDEGDPVHKKDPRVAKWCYRGETNCDKIPISNYVNPFFLASIMLEQFGYKKDKDLVQHMKHSVFGPDLYEELYHPHYDPERIDYLLFPQFSGRSHIDTLKLIIDKLYFPGKTEVDFFEN